MIANYIIIKQAIDGGKLLPIEYWIGAIAFWLFIILLEQWLKRRHDR